MAAAAQSAMSAHRRSLATAAAAGAVLAALWFVPSARAAPDAELHHAAGHGARPTAVAQHGRSHDAQVRAQQLADTGGFESAPYVVGGFGFLCAGGYLVARAPRGV